ncbi:unnamed protein product [Dimorphilus gyrociliatus]|uniref:RING-type domain-containing protein n=1 Tax=Dimorphilus gyrociliatus TaxID=2664684 RepID=A0A7I8VG37_9ANNE|nr:unnamed protein product [Dimorphilus gyrociliatus]
MDDCTTDCPICFNEFLDGLVPRQLPCSLHHILCTDCLVKLGEAALENESKFLCPLCRTEILWSSRGADAFEKVSVKDLFFKLFRRELAHERVRTIKDEEDELKILDSAAKQLHLQIDKQRTKLGFKLQNYHQEKAMELLTLEKELDSVLESTASTNGIDLTGLRKMLSMRLEQITKTSCSLKVNCQNVNFAEINLSNTLEPISTYSKQVNYSPTIIRGKKWFFIITSSSILKIRPEKIIEYPNDCHISEVANSSTKNLYALRCEFNQYCPFKWNDMDDSIVEIEFYAPLIDKDKSFGERTVCFIKGVDLILYDTSDCILKIKECFFKERPLCFKTTSNGLLIVVLNRFKVEFCPISKLNEKETFHGSPILFRGVEKLFTIKSLLRDLKRGFRMLTTKELIYLISPNMRYTRVFSQENFPSEGRLTDFLMTESIFHLCFVRKVNNCFDCVVKCYPVD